MVIYIFGIIEWKSFEVKKEDSCLMKNWVQYTDEEYNQTWDRIDSKLKFSPSNSTFPSFKVPSPFVTYDISHYFGELIDLNVYRAIWKIKRYKLLKKIPHRMNILWNWIGNMSVIG